MIKIPVEEFKERRKRAQELVREKGLDALLVHSHEADFANARYLSDLPFRLELWGEAVDSIRLFDPRSQLSRAIVEQVIVSPAAETASPAKTEISTLIEYLPSDTIVVLEEPHRLEAHYRRIKQNHQHILPLEEAQYRWKAQQVLSLSLLAMEDYGEPLHFETAGQESFGGRLSDAVEAVKSWRADDYLVLLVSDQASRLAELLAEYDLVVGGRVQSLSGAVIALRENIYHGFRLPEIGLAVLTDKEIFGWRKSRTRKSSFYFSDGERLSLLEAQAGDYVVHVQHGIGLYKGLVKLESDGISRGARPPSARSRGRGRRGYIRRRRASPAPPDICDQPLWQVYPPAYIL
jgi:transcription-repair coupling factor (superfamily II helicase)